MQQSRQELAAVWITAAKHDLIAAHELSRRLPHTACFHAQQSADKALKAMLVMLAGDAPRTHVVSALLQAVRSLSPALPEELMTAGAFDQYYLPTRYPDALGGAEAMLVYQETHAREAMAQAETVLFWVETHIAV